MWTQDKNGLYISATLARRIYNDSKRLNMALIRITHAKKAERHGL
jgi:hypothetical protein